MAHLTTEIPRESWREYFDDLSRELGTVETRVEVDGKDLGAQIVTERLVLTGISYDNKDDILVVGLDAPDEGPREDMEHIVDSPQRILVDTTAVLPDTIDVEDSEGHRTLIQLRPAPELPPETTAG
jgi:hypothetical protein